jgi:hypothetical protein
MGASSEPVCTSSAVAACVAAAPVAIALIFLEPGLATLSAFGVLAASSALTGAELFAALGALAANAVLPARLPAVDAASAAMPVLASVGASAAVVAEGVAALAARALGDAVLRRAGRADPEDVTMGFLGEARVC